MRSRSLSAFALLFLLATWVRLPYFFNARDLNSDILIVALQARHLMNGEWSWFLWHCNYQASFEPLLTGIAFKLIGESALTMLLVTYLGYLLTLGMIFAVLRRHLDVPKALVLCLIVTLASQPFLATTVYPPRQWSVTAIFASLWLLDAAILSVPAAALGGFLIFASLYIDFFTIQFLVAAIVFGALCVRGREPRLKLAYGVGLAAGAAFLCLTRYLGPTGGAPLAFSPKVLFQHIGLLRDCLAQMIGLSSSHAAQDGAGRAVQAVVVLAYLALMAFAGWRVLFEREMEEPLRRLALFGGLAAGASIVGFLGSSMASGAASVRYLSPAIWAVPFVLAPWIAPTRLQEWVYVIVPLTLIISWFTWHEQGEHVRGFLPVQASRADGTRELLLEAELRQRAVKVALAPYWTAYRLSFALHEDPVVAPIDAHADRYPPYRTALEHLPVWTEIFHQVDDADAGRDELARLKASGAKFQQSEAGGYTIFYVER